MRIVDVNEYYAPTGGGVRTYVDRKMGILADLGHELIVVAAGKEEAIEERPGGGRRPAVPWAVRCRRGQGERRESFVRLEHAGWL